MPENPGNISDLLEWLSKKWMEHFAQALEAMCSERPDFSSQPQPLSTEQIAAGADAILWWRQDFSAAPEARCWIGAATASWQMIGVQVLKAAGIEDGGTEDLRNTYLEILNQSLAALSQSVSARVGKEVTCVTGSQTAPESAEAYSEEVSFLLGQVECSLLLVFTERFALALEKEPETQNPSPSGGRSLQTQPAASGPSKSMELLLDVELPVSVSFGRAQLPLKDVLKLTTGSIIELNRAVSEPVEVIVNNCVIARGEVVVVEGNFGVRIRQVISRQERIRTLK